MIPIRLEFSNFLSYKGHHELDLSNIHMASIIGPNGAGKSALLDAISWALFGKSREGNIGGRTTNKERDYVINDSADSCEVTLEFEVEGNRFLINRAIDRGKGGFRTQFKKLTADGEIDIRDKRGVDDSIVKELGISQMVFMSSSFITQGDSSRFMESKLTERLEILSEILELDAYDRCLDVTKSKLRNLTREMDVDKSRIEELSAQANRLSELETQEKDLSETVREKKTELETLQKEGEKKNQELTEINTKIAALGESLVEIEKLNKNLEQQGKRLAEIDVESEKQSSILSQKDEIEEGFKKYTQARKIFDEQNEKRERFQTLNDIKNKLERTIELSKKIITTQLEGHRAEETRITESLANENKIKKALDESKEKLEKIQILEEKTDELERELTQTAKDADITTKKRSELDLEIKDLLEHVGISTADLATCELEKLNMIESSILGLKTNLNNTQELLIEETNKKTRIESEIAHINSELDLLEQGEGGTCPLCGQDLSKDDAGELASAKKQKKETLVGELAKNEQKLKKTLDAIEEIKKDIGQKEAQIKQIPTVQKIIEKLEELESISAELAKLTEKKSSQEKEVEETREQNRELLESKSNIQKEHEETKYKINQMETDKARLEGLRDTIKKLENSISSEGYAKDEIEKLKRTLTEIEDVGYDSAIFLNATDQEKNLRIFTDKHKQLDTAEKLLTQYKSESENIKLRVEQDKKNKDLLAQQTKELPELKNKHETLSGETEQTKQQVKNLQEEYDTQISGHQRLLFELEKTREAKQTLESISSKLKESETQTEILNRLKTMFGRDGIPNRILEGVVPQLEEVANNILERISRGRHGSESMRLLFELKRETATGKRNAALDIILSDGENRRPYELFSGGERFRADFAIRLALSHILSQRSGRRLRTLVVDEGFGTQDAEGVGALVEAIHDVSSDFERVLVVSHVEEIKNSFEGQISVWRDGEGSHFTVR